MISVPDKSQGCACESGETVHDNPALVAIVPTSRCNTRCIYCAHYYRKFGEEMSERTYRRIAESVLDDAKGVDLTGDGEAFLSEHFDRMFDDCIERDIEISVVTNGILLRQRGDLLKKLVRNRVHLSISIDGADAETFEYSRPHIKWEQTVESLDCLKKAVEEAGPAADRFRLTFVMVPMKRNIEGLPKLVLLAANYGASELCLLPLTREEHNEKVRGQSLRDCPELVSPAYLQALSLSTRLGVCLMVSPSFRELILDGAERGRGLKGKIMRLIRRMKLLNFDLRQNVAVGLLQRIKSSDRPRSGAGLRFCDFPWDSVFFSLDGAAHACCVMPENLGDVNSQDWSEIWNGPLYRNLRRTIHGWNPTASCRRCAYPSGINGGDEERYEKFFAKFNAETVALDSEEVVFGEGFYDLERGKDGEASHRWAGRKATLTIPMRKGARFLRLGVIADAPVAGPCPGRFRAKGGEWEPFDNTCPEITLPLDGLQTDFLELEIEMDRTHRVGDDPRELGLAIRGICFLFA